MRYQALRLAGIVFALGGLCAHVADAQVLGTFRWRFAPFCNVVSVQVEQRGGAFRLSGSDNGCGLLNESSMVVTGSASLNPGGTADMSLVLVYPEGFSVTTAMTISQATLSGTWKDNWGNSGALTFNPVAPVTGAPRRLNYRGDWSIFFNSTAVSETSTFSISFPHSLQRVPSVEIVPVNGLSTAACPGTVTDPLAAPGIMCVYQQNRQNVRQLRSFNARTGEFSSTNEQGISLMLEANAAATSTFAFGSWAVGVR